MKSTKHPRGLYLLFFTELWERFGFYTLQTIIILYMTKALFMTDDKAYLLYGTFSSMLYLTPVLGGYLADRYLGFQRSVIIGGVLLIIGYGLTAIPSNHSFLLGLSVVIVA
ncbi:MAG: MFS transporter, partial [Chlamydiota bacterium]